MRLFILLILFVSGCSKSYEKKQIKGNPSFVMSDKLMGAIVHSSHKSDIGQNLTFISLNSNQPEILFESGLTFFYKKLFENERTLTLVLSRESQSGAIDSFVIDKKTGEFSRVSAGLIVTPGEGVYSISSLGVCK